MQTYSSKASVIINAPIDSVWLGLTKPELVKQYFFGTNLVTTWQVGSPIFFRGERQGKPYEDKGTVLAYNPPFLLSYNYWSSFSGIADKPELYQVLRYEVAEKDGGVEVAIVQSNVDTAERAEHSQKNWQMVLEGLKKLLENKL